MSSIIADFQYRIQQLEDKIFALEREKGNIPKTVSPFAKKEKAAAKLFAKPWSPQALHGVFTGICTDTRDPWKMGRIQVYCPIIHNLRNALVLSESTLSWARPCSAFGSLDETGSVFIPPEGSLVLIMFEGGNRESLFYIGSTWIPKRADQETEKFAFTPFREQYRWEGSPGIRGSDIRNQRPDHLMPPWNNESYFGNDYSVSTSSDFELLVSAPGTQNINVEGGTTVEERSPGTKNYSTQGWRSADIPHIYGIKTPEKHFIQFDDGSYEREKKLWGKRVVLQSSKGNVLILKDDNDKTCEEIFNNPFFDTYNDFLALPGGTPFTKPANNHAMELNHTGVQLQSFGGGRLIIDDKIRGDLTPGQNNWFVGFPPQTNGTRLWRTLVRLESHTEHRITLSDHHENEEFIRSPRDGIFLNTACGHAIQMQDHTDQNGKAGLERKILVQSTSGHKLEMKDYQCSQISPQKRFSSRYFGIGQKLYRDEAVYDEPGSVSDGKGLPEQVCLKLTSGFGQFLLFEDGSNQASVGEQFAQLSNAPGKNEPHNFLKMYQQLNRKLVHLRCAGDRLTTVELNYLRRTEENELLIAKGNQVHVVENGNMVDSILKRNLIQFVKLGNSIIYCRQGRHLTYAFQNTLHLSFTNPHIILGGVSPDGSGAPPDGASPVLLYDPGGDPKPARVSKWLIAN